MDAAIPAYRFQRILVVKLRQLGDVLLSTPVLAALREQFPAAEIVACVNPGGEQMLLGNSDVSRAMVPPSGGGNSNFVLRWKTELNFARAIRKQRFDLVLDLTTSDRSALLTRVSGASERLGYRSVKGFLGRRRCYTWEVQPQRGEHVVRKHLRMLEPLGIAPKERPLVFPVADEDRDFVGHLIPKGRVIVQVHPISRIAKKNWPAPFMAETVNWIAQRGFLPVITGSADPGEKAEVAKLCEQIEGEHINLTGQLTLKQLGALAERAKFFLGVDTAPMHIAAAVGTPVVALFGPTSENLWAPWCEKALILSRELDCRLPCKNKHGCPTIHCLRDFTPAMALPRLLSFIEGL